MKWKRLAAVLLLAVMSLGIFTGCKKHEMERILITPEEEIGSVALSKTEATTEDGVQYYEENKIKVVSYNIRCANDDNGNSIKERAPRLEQVIDQYDPDLMGFQEYVPGWEKYTDEAFSDTYDSILKYRSKDNYEGTPVFWKRDKFKLLDYGTFWLSETPEVESLGWEADYYRICTWLKLEIRQTGKVFYFYNTHFDYTEPPQVPSAQLLIDRARELDGPVIVTGDFNLKQDSKAYATLTSYFTDANITNDQSVTYTNYGDEKVSKLIDYIFVTGEAVKPIRYNVMSEMPDGKYVSDHYGVYSEVIVL